MKTLIEADRVKEQTDADLRAIERPNFFSDLVSRTNLAVICPVTRQPCVQGCFDHACGG